MKMHGLNSIYKAALILLSVMLALFLFLSYKTMYKQNNSIPILSYHKLTADPGMISSWTISVTDFDNQMSYLQHNFHVVPLKSLLENIKRGIPVPDNTVAVTIDDGYQSNYSLVYPILEKYRIPATFFIVTKYAQNGDGSGCQYTTWGELKNMAASDLVAIESHTYDLHHIVPGPQKAGGTPAALAHIMIDGNQETQEQYDQRIESDLSHSRQDIKTHLGTDSTILCWPYGKYDKHTNKLARQAGFIYILGETGYINPSTDIETIKKVPITAGTSLEHFEKLINPRKINFWQAMVLELGRIQMHVVVWQSHLFGGMGATAPEK